MLEIRYNTESKRVTGWCGDSKQFGNLDRDRDNEATLELDIPIPKGSCGTHLYDEVTQGLIDNPDYVEPEPPRNPLAEIDELKAKIEILEKG